MMKKILAVWNRWVLLGAIGIALMLCILFSLLVSLLIPASISASAPTAVMTMLLAPLPTQATTPTPAGEDSPPVVIDGVSVGSFVQISGTDGAGLRLRSAPGTANSVQFVALDEEVFEVREGPVEQDGYVWWHLAATYDESRNGWAASNYLSVLVQE